MQNPEWLTILDVVTIVLLAAATLMVFFYAPTGKNDGRGAERLLLPCRRRLGGHAGLSSWRWSPGSSTCAPTTAIWDIVGLAGVEIGLVFMLINIVTGSIWAYPVWNTWWTWDPRLTTATIMELAYAAYLMLRSGIEDPERRARFGAVYAIIAFISACR